MQDDELTRQLADAKGRSAVPGATLLDRVLADALRQQPRLPAARQPRAKPGLWARLAGAVGGYPTLAGWCSAMFVGLAVGYADPTTIGYLTGGLSTDLLGADVLGADVLGAVDLFPSADFLATEG